MSTRIREPKGWPNPKGWRARLRRSEEGAVTIPTLLWLPLFLMIMAAGVEFGVLATKQTLFDRGVALSTRILRLGIEPLPAQDVLRRSICTNIGFLHDCMKNITVAVVPIDTTTTPWSAPDQVVDLCDTVKASFPPPGILRGTANQPMLLRACLEVEPMMTANPLGQALSRTENGKVPLLSFTVFINEPRLGS